jgi:hypothetical protein
MKLPDGFNLCKGTIVPSPSYAPGPTINSFSFEIVGANLNPLDLCQDVPLFLLISKASLI